MSKSNQRKRSMYELCKEDSKRFYTQYPKNKDYMRGYNKTSTKDHWITIRSQKVTLGRTLTFLVTFTVTLYLGSQIL